MTYNLFLNYFAISYIRINHLLQQSDFLIGIIYIYIYIYMEGRTSPFEGIVRCGIEQIREGLHPKRIIPSKGEVHPSTIYIYIYIYFYTIETFDFLMISSELAISLLFLLK